MMLRQKMGVKQQIAIPTRYNHPVCQEPKVLEIDEKHARLHAAKKKAKEETMGGACRSQRATACTTVSPCRRWGSMMLIVKGWQTKPDNDGDATGESLLPLFVVRLLSDRVQRRADGWFSSQDNAIAMVKRRMHGQSSTRDLLRPCLAPELFFRSPYHIKRNLTIL